MKPTQKQPEPLKNVAVTGEDIEAAANLHVKWVTEADKFLERAGKLEELANLLLTERDEAIREVERLKVDVMHWRQAFEETGEDRDRSDKELAEEKRRAAAYREGFVGMILRNEVWTRVERGVADASKAFDDFRPEAERLADLEIQKLLADSGGEKEKSE